MQVVFRVDASNQMGMGHVMRCLAMADALRERHAKCQFVHRLHSGHMAGVIRSRGYAVSELPAPSVNSMSTVDTNCACWLGVQQEVDAGETAEVVGDKLVDWLIVDHYALDSDWGRSLRPYVRRIAVIDDLANRRLDCDLLLDQTHGRSEEDYRPLVPSHCEIIVGAWNALLRQGFACARSSALTRRENSRGGLQRILVCMGGSDPENATAVALRGVVRSGLRVDVDVMIGGKAPNLHLLKQVKVDCSRLRVHVDSQEVPELMARADLAIGAGGTTSWERCCMGLPALAVTVTENQRLIVESLAAEGAVLEMGELSPRLEERIAESLNTLNDDPDRLYNMSLAARRICDGNGARRVANRIVEGVRIREN